MATIVGTWRFSKSGVEAARASLNEGKSALDAAEAGVKAVELDTTVTSVGLGGFPDAEGNLQLDAALMTGCGRLGSVMALEGYPAAVPVARAVLEHSPHSLLVGPGARAFATALNIPPVDDPASLLMPLAAKRYAEWVAAGSVAASPETRKHSDTVGILVRDAADRIAAGAATSGMQFKTPGRVGDSPVTGSGLFAEDGAGASVATGDGDRMLRHCIAVRVVDRMGAGEGAEEACVGVVRRLAEREPECQAAVVAMKADGSVGGASTHGGFYVTVWKEGAERQSVVRVEGISGEEWLHSCV